MARLGLTRDKPVRDDVLIIGEQDSWEKVDEEGDVARGPDLNAVHVDGVRRVVKLVRELRGGDGLEVVLPAPISVQTSPAWESSR